MTTCFRRCIASGQRRAFVALLLLAAAVGPVGAAELWVAPNHTATDYRSFLGAIATPAGTTAQRTGEWATAFREMSVFKFAVAAFATEPATSDLTPETAGTAPALALEVKRNAMRLLIDNGKKIALEVGGPYEFFCGVPGEVGEKAAAYDLQTLDRIHRPVKPGNTGLGGRVDYLVMDGPISRVIDGGRANDCDFRTQSDAIREMLDYMRAIRARYPDMKFVWLINVPNWQLYADTLPANGPTGGLNYGFRTVSGAVTAIELSTLVEAVVGATAAAGLPLAAIHVDTPYDFSTPDRMPVLIRLAKRIKALGVPLGVAFNIARGIHWDVQVPFNNLINPRNAFAASRSATATDLVFAEEFKTGTLYASYVWRDQLGRLPEHLVVQSFFKTPFQILPESTPGSFTNVVRDLSLLMKPKPTAPACGLAASAAEYFRLAGSNLYFRRNEAGALCLIAEAAGDQALLEAAQAGRVESRDAIFFRNCQETDLRQRICPGMAAPVTVRDRYFSVFTSLTSDYGCKTLPANFYRMVGNGEVFFSNGADAIVVLGRQSYRPPLTQQLPILNIPTNLCMRVDGALP